jgi:hypothetical protein
MIQAFRWLPLASVLALGLSTRPLSARAAETQAQEGAASATNLPLSEVILYSSGVGFFDRTGEVDGHAEVDLRFKTEDVNDLLKSMVVRDFGGGRVSTVTYGSRDPLTKTLHSFGLDLTENPSLGQLLNQARGERIELEWPNKVAGTILGVEKKQQALGENKTVETEYLNLLTEEGLQSISLAQAQKVKLLNERLNTELRAALEVLAAGHDTQKKTVGISFDGTGKRKVSVGYVVQTPVWKTSYRLVLDDQGKSFLQGWAIVENTSDEDWDKVQLSLVSGRPISFIMDLYQPLYTSRPVVEPESYASLRPQVYDEAMDKQGKPRTELEQMPAAKAGRLMAERPSEVRLDRAAGFGAMDSLGLEDRTGRGGTSSLNEGVVSAAQGAQAGELFQYQVKSPVTLARQKSAMLPILNDNVSGEKVSIYNQRVQPKFPLNGFRLKNSTGLHLMQGPITVFDDSAYAGDARIEDLAPGQERLLSYGLDLKIEVEAQHPGGRNDLINVKVRKGTLIATRKTTEELTYNVRNRDQKKKTVLIEHPFRSDWELLAPKEKPERTREVYRFAVTVEPNKTEKLVVQEEKQFEEQVQLINSANDVIAYYIRAQRVSGKVKEALEQVVKLRDQLNQTIAERTRREQRTTEIAQEQGRIRENMQRLAANSELYTRYVKKLDQQETELETLRAEIESFKNTQGQQQRGLNEFLLNINVE